jgi:hypothetical protein
MSCCYYWTGDPQAQIVAANFWARPSSLAKGKMLPKNAPDIEYRENKMLVVAAMGLLRRALVGALLLQLLPTALAQPQSQPQPMELKTCLQLCVFNI